MAIWDDPSVIYSDTPLTERLAFQARLRDCEEEAQVLQVRLAARDRIIERQQATIRALLRAVGRRALAPATEETR